MRPWTWVGGLMGVGLSHQNIKWCILFSSAFPPTVFDQHHDLSWSCVCMRGRVITSHTHTHTHTVYEGTGHHTHTHTHTHKCHKCKREAGHHTHTHTHKCKREAGHHTHTGILNRWNGTVEWTTGSHTHTLIVWLMSLPLSWISWGHCWPFPSAPPVERMFGHPPSLARESNRGNKSNWPSRI